MCVIVGILHILHTCSKFTYVCIVLKYCTAEIADIENLTADILSVLQLCQISGRLTILAIHFAGFQARRLHEHNLYFLFNCIAYDLSSKGVPSYLPLPWLQGPLVINTAFI